MRKAFALAFALVLVGSAALASNTGFKLNYNLVFNTGKSNVNWIAPPYFFYPSGNVGETPQSALNWCYDIHGVIGSSAKVVTINRWNVLTETFLSKPCKNTLTVFNLEPGIAYGLVPNGAGQVVDIVGSHDDDFAPNKNPTFKTVPVLFAPGKASLNWISVPYHSKSDNALDLCFEVNGASGSSAKIVTINKWNVATETFLSKPCKNTLAVFNLVPGEGYGFVPNGGAQVVAFNVY